MNTPIISFSSNSDMNFYSSRFFISIIVLALMLVSHITIGRTTSSTTLKANEFLNIALDCGTDKVTAHHYDLVYSKYLPSLRMKPVSMLEIGLGCNLQYGPGKSLELWTRYFPHKNA